MRDGSSCQRRVVALPTDLDAALDRLLPGPDANVDDESADAVDTAFAVSGRIDSPEEFVIALRSERGNAVPLAFAIFLLITTLPRPAPSRAPR